MGWKEWSGWFAVTSYEVHHESEYEALRHAAGLIDVSPLFKYDVTGPGALDVLNRVMTRNVARLAVGQVAYGGWCDAQGLMVDDGTIARLDDAHYRVTANGSNLRWLEEAALGFDARVEDTTERLAALALQGPTSRAALREVCDADLDRLRFFRLARGTVAARPVVISRTGYTGDLGYEIWMDARDALPVWDALIAGGAPHGVTPVGLLALDLARLEAGLILAGVDYHGCRVALTRNLAYTPFEAGLGWTVELKGHPQFVGRESLVRQREHGIPRSIVGLDIRWEPLEALYEKAGLPPQLPSTAWRSPVPVYSRWRQVVGRATSGCWSPTLKKNIALATLAAPHDQPGSRVEIEVTVDFRRHTVPAVVVKLPFFDPPRKKATPAAPVAPAAPA
jgi:aminomethyltransferase